MQQIIEILLMNLKAFEPAKLVKCFLSILLVLTSVSGKAQPDTRIEARPDGTSITTTTETIGGDTRTIREYRARNGRRTRMEGEITYNGDGPGKRKGRDLVEVNFNERGDSLYSRRLIYDSENNLIQRRIKRFNESRRVFDEQEWLNADGTRWKLRVYDPRTGGYDTYPKEEYSRVTQGNWGTTSASLSRTIGKRFTIHFPPGNPGSVWGDFIYTDDSSIATAAVHAGLITTGSGGTVTIEIRAGQSSYTGSVRNGVSSGGWGNWGGSFVFIR